MNNSTRQRLMTDAVFVLAAAVLMLDLLVELGVAAPVIYVGVVWLAWSTKSGKMVLITASLCTTFTVLGLAFSPIGGEWWKVILNRGLAVSAVWVTATLANRHLTMLEDQRIRADSLQEEKNSIQQQRDSLSRLHDQQRERAQVMLSITEDLREQRAQLEQEVHRRRRTEKALKEREEHIHTLLDSTAEGIYGIDLEGHCTFANQASARLLGYESPDELLGQQMHELIHHSHKDGSVYSNADCQIYRAFRQGKGVHIDSEVFWRRDGSCFAVEYWSYPIRQSGRSGGSVVTFLDITERVQAAEQFRQVVEASPSGMVMIDQSGTIRLVNAETESLFRYTREQLIGEPVELLIPTRFCEIHPVLRDTFFESPTARSMGHGRELFGMRQDGSEFPIEIGLNPVQIGDEMFVLSSIVDITERKAAESEIQRINIEVGQKNEELQQFVYTVSHDLKSPLVTLEGFVGFLREEIENNNLDEVGNCLNRIERSTARMGQLIDDLLQLSRVGQVRNDPEPVDLNRLVADIAIDLGTQIEKAGFVLTVEPDLPTVSVDRIRIAQVFENLITNALKYGGGADQPEIEIGVRESPQEVVVFVRDNGAGIAKEHQDRIFAPFERLQSGEEGTGIGLAIVHRIVQINGGSVRINSEPGQGAEFCLEFPSSLIQ